MNNVKCEDVTPMPCPQTAETGAQRLPIAQLREWESLKLGAMIGFGMSTFTGALQEPYRPPAATYAPRRLEIEQWLDVLCEFDLKYAILLAKHNAGFCLWHTRQTDYHCGRGTGDTRDVVGLFVEACRARGIRPCLYYNLGRDYYFGEGHGHGQAYIDHLFDNLGKPGLGSPLLGEHLTEAYFQYAMAQVRELLTGYGDIYELWFDTPSVVSHLNGVRRMYDWAAALQPSLIILMNAGFTDGRSVNPQVWPTDLINGEDTPPPPAGHEPWKTLDGRRTYLPMEVQYRTTKRWMNTYDWFDAQANVAGHVRPAQELARIRRSAIGKGANLVWNLSPDRRARIPRVDVELLREVNRLAQCEV